MPNLSHTPDTFDEYLGIIKTQHEFIEKMRGFIVPKTPIDPGTFLDAYISGASSPLTLTPNIDRPALVTNILFSYNPAALATLAIGPTSGTLRTITIPATNAEFPIPIVCAMIIKPGDSFTLTVAGATATYIEVMGKILSGTDWSQV